MFFSKEPLHPPKTFWEIRDSFDLLGIAVVLVGTNCLVVVVRWDEQVHNRCIASHRFHRFGSQVLEAITAIWEDICCDCRSLLT